MISDVLFEALADIRGYLSDPITAPYYGAVRERIDALVAEMDAVRVVLDTPPVMAVMYTCQFCGAESYRAPEDQVMPVDYCHPGDHR